jgi:hypothetical protein
MPGVADAIQQQLDVPLCVCAVCGAPVVVYNGNQFRHCEHAAANVTITPAGMQEMTRAVS